MTSKSGPGKFVTSKVRVAHNSLSQVNVSFLNMFSDFFKASYSKHSKYSINVFMKLCKPSCILHKKYPKTPKENYLKLALSVSSRTKEPKIIQFLMISGL